MYIYQSYLKYLLVKSFSCIKNEDKVKYLFNNGKYSIESL